MKNYILISGASSDIGTKIAISLSKKYNIIIHGTDLKKLNKIKKECSNKNKKIIWKCDFRKITNINSFSKNFFFKYKIFGFIHCSGKFYLKPTRLIKNNELKDVWNINYFSCLDIIKRLVSLPNKKFLKKVIFISSNISGFGSKGTTVYNATKAALDASMKSLAVEFAPNIQFNSVLPGTIKTKMISENIPSYDEKIIIKKYPTGFGKPKNISDICEFLISQKSNWITGQQIIVDGGRSVNLTD